MKAVCPHCNQRLKFADSYAGKGIKCPGCEQRFVAPFTVPAAQTSQPSEQSHTKSQDAGSSGMGRTAGIALAEAARLIMTFAAEVLRIPSAVRFYLAEYSSIWEATWSWITPRWVYAYSYNHVLVREPTGEVWRTELPQVCVECGTPATSSRRDARELADTRWTACFVLAATVLLVLWGYSLQTWYAAWTHPSLSERGTWWEYGVLGLANKLQQFLHWSCVAISGNTLHTTTIADVIKHGWWVLPLGTAFFLLCLGFAVRRRSMVDVTSCHCSSHSGQPRLAIIHGGLQVCSKSKVVRWASDHPDKIEVQRQLLVPRWEPNNEIKDFHNKPLPQGLDFFVPPPAEIGEVMSADTTLKTDDQPAPFHISYRIAVCLTVATAFLTNFAFDWFGLTILTGIWIPRIVAVCLAGCGFAIPFALSKFRHHCRYVGLLGVADFNCAGHRWNLYDARKLVFTPDLQCTPATDLQLKGGFKTAYYAFEWRDRELNLVLAITGSHSVPHYAKDDQPPADDAYWYARAAYISWLSYCQARGIPTKLPDQAIVQDDARAELVHDAKAKLVHDVAAELVRSYMDLFEMHLRNTPRVEPGTPGSEDLKRIAAQIRSPKTTETTSVTMADDPWMRFSQFVKLPTGVPDSKVQSNMRFQFMFKSEADAERVLGSLPQKFADALSTAECWWRGLNPEGKFQIAWDQVRLTVPQGKDLMNSVISAGGEIYEAFLD